jgi:DNA-directed RNA polymerase specialized sigma subunit
MQGNLSGRDELIERYVNHISRMRWTHSISKDDMRQEAWCIRLKCQKTYDPSHGLSYNQFESLCIYRHLLRLISSTYYKSHVSMDDTIDFSEPSTKEDHDVYDAKILYDRLAPKEQMIIKEYYGNNKTFAQIGAKLGITKQAAEMRHGTILRKLRAWSNV